mmetsp:Transcript_39089/g.51547  ORF Transcript_39089/g.51547 Transcript_39089/m.51547 type:complete len:453 (+) Transcript_39089:36-1394(+)
MVEYEARDRQQTTDVRYLYVLPVLFYEYLALSLTRSLIPRMMVSFFGSWTYQIIGISEAVKGILAFVSCSVFGKLSDKVGRRKCLFLTVLGTCFPVCLLAFTGNLWFFVAAQAFSGCFASTFPLTFAYISDFVPKEERAPAYGLALATFGLSFSIGPVTGGYLAKIVGAHVVFTSSLILTICDLVFIVLYLPESNRMIKHPSEPRALYNIGIKKEHLPTDFNPLETLKVFKGDRFLSRVAVVTFLYYIGVWALVSTLMIYVTRQFQFSAVMIGYLLSAFGICTMLAEGLLVRYTVPVLGERLTLQIGLLGFAAQCVIIGLATSVWMIYSCMIFSFLSNLVYPSISSLVSRSVGMNAQGEALGAINGVKALTEGFGPLVFGYMLSMFETTFLPGTPYLVAAVFALSALIVSFSFPEEGGMDGLTDLEDISDPLEGKGLLDDDDDDEIHNETVL